MRYFGADRPLDSIKPIDADAWCDWLATEGNNREGKPREDKNGQTIRHKTTMAANTVRKRSQITKQFFNYAVKAGIISSNPFSGLVGTVTGNEARQFFVTLDVFETLIEHCNGAEWEAVIALSRLAGLRAPSELMRLRWEDVDFSNGRIRIHASKTEHHKDGGIRYCPLFPALRPFLERLSELARAKGHSISDYVITDLRGSESLLRTGLLRILKRAGIKPWPKLFQNLRASRETELMDEFPIRDVCAWIGNSQIVAMKHYAMQRGDSFARAAGLDHERRGPAGGPVNGVSSHLEATRDLPPIDSGNEKTQENPGFDESWQSGAVPDVFDKMGGTGPAHKITKSLPHNDLRIRADSKTNALCKMRSSTPALPNRQPMESGHQSAAKQPA